MSILRLRDYVADVEVLGEVRRAEYHNDTLELTIHDVDIATAGDILEKLATGKLTTVQQNAEAMRKIEGVAQQVEKIKKLCDMTGRKMLDCRDALVATGGDLDRAYEKLTGERGAPPAPAHVDPNPTIAPGTGAPLAPVVDLVTPPQDGKPGCVAAVPPEAAAPESGTLEDAFQKEEQAKNVPPELASAKRLKDVLVYFEGQGVKGADALVEACEMVKSNVPVLSRIANLSERVRRTYEIMESEAEGN